MLQKLDKPTFKMTYSEYLEMLRNIAVPALDEYVGPDWPFLVNTDTLDMSTTYMCIGGQLFGDVGYGIKRMYGTEELSPSRTIFGNLSERVTGETALDDKAWKVVIYELRNFRKGE